MTQETLAKKFINIFGRSYLGEVVKRINTLIELTLYSISIYVVPLIIVLISFVALEYWPSQFISEAGTGIKFKVVQDEERKLDPSTATEALKNQPTVDFNDTKLLESPFWLQFSVPDLEAQEQKLIEFPSRHASSLTCWSGPLLKRIGGGDREAADGLAGC